MSKLLIVESPAKSKTIGRYLGRDYRVLASVGHIRDLPKSNRQAIDLERNFSPHYEVVAGKEKVVEEIKRAAKKASEVLLATDPDREGEAIAWHVAEAADLHQPKRVVFHEITKEAILTALREPRPLDKNLRRAQEARRVLDRLFGYELSELIWKKLRYGLSAGRVQSPALRLIVEREKEIRAFIPEKFWVIEAVLQTPSKDDLLFTCAEEPPTENEAKQIVERARESTWRVAKIEQTEVKRSPRPPFTTSTLQQAASSRLGLSPAQTMRLAQKLYEAGHITYMRTDSTNLAETALKQLAIIVTNNYGANYLEPHHFKTKSKNAQEAHEAIRPTNPASKPTGSSTEAKLYHLIWSRTVASQMKPAILSRTKITAAADNSSIPNFTINGSIVRFDGWLRADPAARGEENVLPALVEGNELSLQKIEAIGKETEPPRRYTEAGLVKELEKRGIGRPSTYATIIKTLADRGYTEKLGRALQPTETGEAVSDFLTAHFTNYVSDSFTAQMENELDEIALGNLTYETSLDKFYWPFHKLVEHKKTEAKKITDLGTAPAEFKCPECGGSMVYKLSRAGKFLSCQRFPECRGARTTNGEALNQNETEKTGETCSECGGDLVWRQSRYGRFLACGNYPKCKYVKKDATGNDSTNDTGVKCPICKKGTMVEKRGRYGSFYGCSNYPACKQIIKSKPTGKICGYQRETGFCPHLMMEGTKTIPERCSDKSCPNHNPQKLG